MAVVFEAVAVNVAAKKGRPAKKGKGKAKDTPAVPAVPAHTHPYTPAQRHMSMTESDTPQNVLWCCQHQIYI